MDGGLDAIMFTVSVWALPVLLAVTLHEAAHGWVAMKLGDPTAAMLGRVSFNPLRHIHPVGTVILPALMLLAMAARAVNMGVTNRTENGAAFEARWNAARMTFWCEAVALMAFGVSWAVKGRIFGLLED
mgnify:CR=1 FL=1